MSDSPLHEHDRESIRRAGALLRYYHAGNERAWIALLHGDTRPAGHYATICALAAITNQIVELIAHWTDADPATILATHENTLAKTAAYDNDTERHLR